MINGGAMIIDSFTCRITTPFLTARSRHISPIRPFGWNRAFVVLSATSSIAPSNPERARFADQRMVFEFLPAFRQIRRGNVAHVFDDAFVAQQLDVARGDRGARRMAGVREAVVEVAAVGEARSATRSRHHHAADRQIARRHTLCHHEQVGFEIVVFRREPAAGAAEAGDHFVDDEQDSVFFADAPHFGPIARRRHDDAARALNRFADERSDFVGANGFDPPLEVARAFDAELFGGQVAAIFEVVRLRDVLDARDRQAALLVHVRHAAEARAAHRAAVVRVFAADDHVAIRLTQRTFQY